MFFSSFASVVVEDRTIAFFAVQIEKEKKSIKTISCVLSKAKIRMKSKNSNENKTHGVHTLNFNFAFNQCAYVVASKCCSMHKATGIKTSFIP